MIFLHFERIPLLKHHQFGVISQPANQLVAMNFAQDAGSCHWWRFCLGFLVARIGISSCRGFCWHPEATLCVSISHLVLEGNVHFFEPPNWTQTAERLRFSSVGNPIQSCRSCNWRGFRIFCGESIQRWASLVAFSIVHPKQGRCCCVSLFFP